MSGIFSDTSSSSSVSTTSNKSSTYGASAAAKSSSSDILSEVLVLPEPTKRKLRKGERQG